MLSILKLVILFGVLVIIHESAHFLVAKACKVKVLEFSIGFGPQILKRTKNGTCYSIRLIPLGGFVNMYGMDDKSCKEEGSYQNAKTWQKVLILLAGIVVNILFGLLLYFILICQMADIDTAFKATGGFIGELFESIRMLFTGGVSAEQFMGPIGITELVSETVAIEEFVYIMSVVSLSLGITNLLPIPPLDGSKILILLIEKIRRKPLKEETELKIQFVGFVFIVLFSVYVAFNDVIRMTIEK